MICPMFMLRHQPRDSIPLFSLYVTLNICLGPDSQLIYSRPSREGKC